MNKSLRTVLLLLMASAVAITAPAVADAQERKPRTLFDMLFKRSPEPPPQRAKKPRVSTKRKVKAVSTERKARAPRRVNGATAAAPTERTRTRRPLQPALSLAAPDPRDLIIPDKIADAQVVLVVGDFVGGGLAEGMTEAFALLPGVRVVSRTNGSSGFVREDYYNWTSEIGAIIDAEKPKAVVMMIGSNDRQKMLVDGVREDIRSAKWDSEYSRRAGAFAAAVRQKNIPLYWVGMPPFRSRSMAADMLALNALYRGAAETAGGTFVDIWDGFVDAEGNFVTRGPDINGQEAQLRAGDGINLTRSGKRKVAFYVERELKKILGGALDPNIGTLTKENLPVLSLNPLSPVSAGQRMAPLALDDPALDGGEELLGASVAPSEYGLVRLPVQTMAIDGIAPQSKPGRADDFSWPPKDLPKPQIGQPQQ
jgi:hypothetical protein